MKRAYLIPADLTNPTRSISLQGKPLDGGEFTYLPAMYDAIGCSIVERIECTVIPRSCLWVDEEGRMRSDVVLNVRASILAGREIVGDVVLAGDDGERTIDLDVRDEARFLASLELLAKSKVIASRLRDIADDYRKSECVLDSDCEVMLDAADLIDGMIDAKGGA